MEREGMSRASSVVVGLLLIGAGVVFLAMQWYGLELPLDLARVGWPVFIIAPGVVLLFVGLLLPATPGVALAIAGSIVTTVGLVLAYQSSADHYASWAYAWALVGPAAVGLGMILWGSLHLRRNIAASGLATLGAGLVLFLVGFAFFEGVLNLGGDRGLAPLGRQALPIALIVAGVLVIATRLGPRRRRDAWSASRHHPSREAPMTGASSVPADPPPSDPGPSLPDER